jgi:hypothetical protein
MAWPSRRILRAARLAALANEATANTAKHASHAEIKAFDHFLVALRHGRLLVHPIDDQRDLKLLITASCDVSKVASNVSTTARQIARIFTRPKLEQGSPLSEDDLGS